jgi:hypothetical protein
MIKIPGIITLGESIKPEYRGVEDKENTIERELQGIILFSFTIQLTYKPPVFATFTYKTGYEKTNFYHRINNGFCGM